MAGLLLVSSPLHAQQVAEIQSAKVADGVYMLTGQGGNIGLSVGAQGAFLVDDQMAPLTDEILAAVAEVSAGPVRFVVNTHFHADHTGGNENLGKAGALIVAHDNVRKRLSVETFIATFDMRTPPAPEGALPVITFGDAVTFHWNGGEIRVAHVKRAHTDGDVLIHFAAQNVIHAGDVFFNGFYPFIDVAHGGTTNGTIAAMDAILAMADESTRIIPGHGPLGDVAAAKAFRDMLVTVRDRVRGLIDRGKSRDDVIAARPSADLDAEWGDGFLPPDVFVGAVYDGLVVED